MTAPKVQTDLKKAIQLLNGYYHHEAQLIGMAVHNDEAFRALLNLDYRDTLIQHNELSRLFLSLVKCWLHEGTLNQDLLKCVISEQGFESVIEEKLLSILLDSPFSEETFYQVYEDVVTNQRRAILFQLVEKLAERLAADEPIDLQRSFDYDVFFAMDRLFLPKRDEISSWSIKDKTLNAARTAVQPNRKLFDQLIVEVPLYGASILVFPTIKALSVFSIHSLEFPLLSILDSTLYFNNEIHSERICSYMAAALLNVHPDNLALRKSAMESCTFWIYRSNFHHFSDLQSTLRRFKMQHDVKTVFLQLNDSLYEQLKSKPELIRLFGSFANDMGIRLILLTLAEQNLVDLCSEEIAHSDPIVFITVKSDEENELSLTPI